MLGMIIGPAALGAPAGMVGNVLVGRVPAPHGADAGRPRASLRVPARAPVVIGATMVAFGLTGLRLGTSWSLPAFLVFDATMVTLAVVDAEHHLLPRRIFYPGLVGLSAFLVMAAVADDNGKRLGIAVAIGLVTWVIFAALHVANPGGLGFGDVRLAGLLGLALGWLGPTFPAIGILVGCILAVVTWAVLGAARRVSRATPLPFGTFLAVGSIIAVLCGR